MTTSPIAGDSQIANALTTLGTTALGSTRNELLTQLIVAAANATGGGSGGAAWGDITGTLSAQTDLQTALDAKLALVGGTMTGALTINPASGPILVAQSASVTKLIVTADGNLEPGGWYSTATGVNAVLSGQGAFTLLGYSGLWKVYLNNNEFGPWVDGEVSLGTAAKGWKDAVINGACDAGSFKVGGVAGANFSGVVTNITVVNGIVTAIS